MADEWNKRGVTVFYNRAQEPCRSNSETIYAPCGAGISASILYVRGAPHPVSNSVSFTPLLDGIGRKWRGDMKTFHILKTSLIALALLPVPNVFAANRGQLHVSSPEDVAGQTLDAGDYIVLWEGDGPNVELKILQSKKVVATATAHAVQLQTPSINDSAVINVNGQKRSLSMIFFLGKTVALEIPGPSAGVNVSSR